MLHHKGRVVPPKPLAGRADLTHFQGGILNFLWRVKLTYEQRSIFAAVLFCFLTDLAVNAWGAKSAAGNINDTAIWGATEAVRCACQDWLVTLGVGELRNFIVKWQNLVNAAVTYLVDKALPITISMPHWLDRYAAETPEFRELRYAEFELSVHKCRITNTLVPASPSAAAGLAVPPAITLQSLRRRHRRQFCSPQPWQLEGQQYTTTTSHTPRWPAPSAPHGPAQPSLPHPRLQCS